MPITGSLRARRSDIAALSVLVIVVCAASCFWVNSWLNSEDRRLDRVMRAFAAAQIELFKLRASEPKEMFRLVGMVERLQQQARVAAACELRPHGPGEYRREEREAICRADARARSRILAELAELGIASSSTHVETAPPELLLQELGRLHGSQTPAEWRSFNEALRDAVSVESLREVEEAQSRYELEPFFTAKSD